MSRLDQHITAVRSKLTIGLFFGVLAWLALAYGALVWAVILAERLLDRPLPRFWTLLFAGCAAVGAAALAYSLLRRPSRKLTAVTIDQTLGLKEKFSTALYVRQQHDPFAMAVVRDAEHLANHLSLSRRFPLTFPRQGWGAVGVATAALLTAWLMPYVSWGNQATSPRNIPKAEQVAGKPKDLIAPSLPKIESALAALNNNDDAIKRAKIQMAELEKLDELDPKGAHRTANEALEQTHQTLVDEIAKNEKFQSVVENNRLFSQMDQPEDKTSPFGQAQKDLSEGKIDEAMDKIEQGVKDFKDASPAEQEKAVKQAKQLADALKKIANDPKTQQRMTDQLQQMGATAEQAQQLSNLMKQAANGDPNAAQQVQQAANQMIKNMNGGQGPTQQQANKIKQLMAQAQGLANSQAQAQSLAGSAQQLAQAMQGAQGQGKGQNSGAQSQMAQAQAQVQSQLGNMEAAAQDAQAMQAGMDASGQAAQDALADMNGNGQPRPGQGNQGGNGNNNQAGGGAGDLGPGGGKMGIAEAPFGIQKQVDVGVENTKGKILVARDVFAGIDPGKSTAERQNIAKVAEQDAPEEIDMDYVSHDSRQAVNDYFSALQKANSN